ncbi:hypothetical protein P171DRAFT_449850 [Karstenula rhodostoma CBS 690.94]|uniref:Uncharacterized protein n=1 Tax=Karstenula rhodostoma CBS 690.94 TaxID=1392251 RepID=A0A9P4U535_9PLEO|nr:hypothetical protein P171DRAFT_449850 [Karstenula rhodostoma CBS 690.94]
MSLFLGIYLLLLLLAISLVGSESKSTTILHGPLDDIEAVYRSAVSAWRKDVLFQDHHANSNALTCLASRTPNPAFEFLHASAYTNEELTRTLEALGVNSQKVLEALAAADFKFTTLHRRNYAAFAKAEAQLIQTYMDAVGKAKHRHDKCKHLPSSGRKLGFRILHQLFSHIHPLFHQSLSSLCNSTTSHAPQAQSPYTEHLPKADAIVKELIDTLVANVRSESLALELHLHELTSAYRAVHRELWTLDFATDFYWKRVHLGSLVCLWYTGSTTCTSLSLEARSKSREWEGMQAVLQGLQDARAQVLGDLVVVSRLDASVGYAGEYLAELKEWERGGGPGRRLARLAAALGMVVTMECVDELPG